MFFAPLYFAFIVLKVSFLVAIQGLAQVFPQIIPSSHNTTPGVFAYSDILWKSSSSRSASSWGPPSESPAAFRRCF